MFGTWHRNPQGNAVDFFGVRLRRPESSLKIDTLRMGSWLIDDRANEPEIVPPTGEDLLDDESREKLPPLDISEVQGLDSLSKVMLFTPDSSWSWFAGEYDGGDILFELVAGLEIKFGYFSLSELLSVRRLLGLPIERYAF